MVNELFTPYSFGKFEIKSRIVRSATEYFCSDELGHVTDIELEAYRKLSNQPLGMIITAHTCVSPEGRSNMQQNAAFDESYFDDLKAVNDAASFGGIPVILQLGHGGMKAEGSNGGRKVFTPDNMTLDEIKNVAESFGRAALLAKNCGYSGVMLHSAHLYLLSQFLYPEYNHRTDRFGGIEGGYNVTLMALREVRKACGDDYPVFIKINSTDKDKSEDYTKAIGHLLERAYVNGLTGAEISGWDSAPRGIPWEPYFINQVGIIHSMTDLPLIEVGGIRTAEDALDALDAGAAAVSLCRPLICEPDFPTRMRDEENAISRCVGCCKCFAPLAGEERCALNKKKVN